MIPKIIHVSWKNKNILDDDSVLIENGLKKLVDLNPDWELQISDDEDVDRYLMDALDSFDYDLLKNRHIVEKLDVWRLIKIYNVGGIYTDIDRLSNVSIESVTSKDAKCVLPTCLDYDFSHDFMMSRPLNPIYATALQLNLKRRREGHQNIYYLGPQTYMNAVTKCLIGYELDVNIGTEKFNELRNVIDSSVFIQTYREYPPVDSFLYRNGQYTKEQLENMKKDFYKKHNMKHWSGQW
jgi:mannosyltransferase OCH1-like enzyme